MKNVQRVAAILTVFAFASFGLTPTARAQYKRPYRYNDNYMRQLIRQLETHTDRFSNLLPNALDRSRVNGASREDDVNRLVTDFEHATDQLKQRFNRGESTDMDAQAVLQEGALINTFMRNHQLDYRTERVWNLVRRDLNRLAGAYDVARNWDTMQWPTPTNGPIISSFGTILTGTYRLNAAQSNDPRSVANRATRNLNYGERQNIYDLLIRRLTPPDMLAIERRGDDMTLASTRSPQVTIHVDGREHVESYPGGRTSHVIARFYGDQLSISSQGDRPNDFTVSFEPLDGGRRLLVLRRVYAGRLNQTVVERSYYDKTSDVAQLNLFNTNPVFPVNDGTGDNFIIPNGTQIVAVLNNNLSTRTSRNDDRFTMTVRSPAQYDGATIEGYVSGVNRSGRITGRSEMTLNFDRIRLRDGRSYRFAGIVQNVVATRGEKARVDAEGDVQEGQNRTNTTLERTAIGSAVGAIIGAIAGGGNGAAIGATVGAGLGAGSIYAQGRDDLNLMSGTEVTIQASAPGYVTAR